MPKNSVFFSFAILFFIICSADSKNSLAQPTEEVERQSYQKIYDGNLLMDNGDYEKAIAAYQDAVKLTPNAAQPYYYISFLYTRLEHLDEAQFAAEKALQLWPRYPEAHALLGAIHLRKQAFKHAFSELTFAIAQKYEQPDALNNLGGYYLLYKHRADSATYFFSEAVRIDSTFGDAYINLANSYLHQKEVTRATAAAQRALALQPNNPDAYFSLANAYFLDGKYSEAIDHYHKALTLDSHLASVRYNLARALLADGKINDAEMEYEYLKKNHFVKLSGLLQEEIAAVKASR